MTNWSSTRTSTGTGSTVELDDRQVNSIDVYDCMSSTAARQLVSYCLMMSLSLCGMSSSIDESTIDRYRFTSNVKLPLRIMPVVNGIGTSQVQYTVAIKGTNKCCAWDSNTTTVDCKAANGKASKECGGTKTAQNILGLGECIAVSFVRVLTGAVLRQ